MSLKKKEFATINGGPVGNRGYWVGERGKGSKSRIYGENLGENFKNYTKTRKIEELKIYPLQIVYTKMGDS